MGELDDEIERRTAAVWSPTTGEQGTGFWIGGTVLLTAGHVSGCAADTVVQYRWQTGGAWLDGRVRVADEALDVAVVTIDAPPEDPTVAPMWIARPPRAGQAQVVGYPVFQREGGVQKLRDTRAEYVPLNGKTDGECYGKVSADHVEPHEWSGMSGASFFVEGRLAGIVVQATEKDLRARALHCLRERSSPVWRAIEEVWATTPVSPRLLEILGDDKVQSGLAQWLFPADRSDPCDPADLVTAWRQRGLRHWLSRRRLLVQCLEEQSETLTRTDAAVCARELLCLLVPSHPDAQGTGDRLAADIEEAGRTRRGVELVVRGFAVEPVCALPLDGLPGGPRGPKEVVDQAIQQLMEKLGQSKDGVTPKDAAAYLLLRQETYDAELEDYASKVSKRVKAEPPAEPPLYFLVPGDNRSETEEYIAALRRELQAIAYPDGEPQDHARSLAIALESLAELGGVDSQP